MEALGAIRGGWLSLHEVLGGHRYVSVRRNGKRLTIRLNTSDILVWHSIFVREEYQFKLPQTPMTIIDAGLHWILFGLLCRKIPSANPGPEPEPSNFELLVRNTESFRMSSFKLALFSQSHPPL
jgi:hypothetical protein